MSWGSPSFVADKATVIRFTRLYSPIPLRDITHCTVDQFAYFTGVKLYNLLMIGIKP